VHLFGFIIRLYHDERSFEFEIQSRYYSNVSTDPPGPVRGPLVIGEAHSGNNRSKPFDTKQMLQFIQPR